MKLWCVTFNFFSLFNIASIVSLKKSTSQVTVCFAFKSSINIPMPDCLIRIYCTLCIVSRISEQKHIFPFGYNREIMKMHRRKPFKFLLQHIPSLSLKLFRLSICKVNIERLLFLTRYDSFSSRFGFPHEEYRS